MTDLSRALDFALEAAEAAGKIALHHYQQELDAQRKADGTWVTKADWAVEAQVRIRIARAFPNHNILGEEEGLSAAGGGAPHEGAPTWIVDPIDGTNNYIAGIPIWATLMALRVDGESLAGVCHAPMLNETYDGAVGLGARMNGKQISVDPIRRFEDATLCHAGAGSFRDSNTLDLYERLVARAWRDRGFGDFWGHMLVARGAAHVMVEPTLKLWDVAPLEPIVSEAGGRITGPTGTPWTEDQMCITTCGTLHDEVLELVHGTHGPGG
ncbi:MAG TPA: inositol monophosphatase family protein [Actinomycetota bacterium]|nr:inositol monophosphatase family protein [Actinomycetota bacterium]